MLLELLEKTSSITVIETDVQENTATLTVIVPRAAYDAAIVLLNQEHEVARYEEGHDDHVMSFE